MQQATTELHAAIATGRQNVQFNTIHMGPSDKEQPLLENETAVNAKR